MLAFFVVIAAATLLFFVKKEDDNLTIAKKISLGILLSLLLVIAWIFLGPRLMQGSISIN